MKKFIKMVLAVVCGIFLTTMVFIAILSAFVAGVSSTSKPAQLPKQGVMVIDMSSILFAEQSAEADPLSMIQGGGNVQTLGLWQAVQAINMAAGDPMVQFIYLKTDGNLTPISTLEELRRSLASFRNSGKPVIAYTEAPSTGGYYLASVADKVYMTSDEGATSMLTGVSGQLIFLKDILDKLGVNVQLIRHGKYKSAGEMFIRNSASQENMEQNLAMVNSIWGTCAEQIAASREIGVDQLNEAIDNLKLCTSRDFVDAGLVDSLMTRNQLEKKIADLAVVDSFDDVKVFSIADYANTKVLPNLKSRQFIAVVYADGDIVDGSASQDVAGTRFASVIEKVRADSTVKAVVLRVNSPGGSVLASEKIRDEIELTRAVKPVIASYGNYAASGGYWISSSCDKIFSDATTLTGSIGCFSMIPDVSGTLKNVAHVNVTAVNSNKHGDMYGLMRPLDEAEKAYMQRSVENIYDKFTSIVAEGRDLTQEYVDEIGQGRVWTGADGARIGLVDEIGTLEDAIRFAAVSAGDPDLASWNVTGYPKPQTAMEMIIERMSGSSPEAAMFKGTSMEHTAKTLVKWGNEALKSPKVLARIPYEININ